MRWQLEQAEEFRQEVEQYTDAERVVLADAYQALLGYGPLPTRLHHLRSIGSATRAPATPLSWCCHRSCSATRSSVTSSWSRRPTSSGPERRPALETFTPVDRSMPGHLAG